MKLKNHELESFILFLDKFKLFGFESRMRTRFKNLLIEKYVLFNKEREDIIKEYAERDVDGNLVVIEENGVKVHPFKEDSKDQAIAELNELVTEDVIIEETQERESMITSVKNTVLNSRIEFEGKEADDYARFCDILEGVE